MPGPGDRDGQGKATVSLKGDRICYTLSWRKVDAPTAAHMHVGGRDVAGPVVLGLLSVPAPGLQAPVSSVGGCVDAPAGIAAAIKAGPTQLLRQHPQRRLPGRGHPRPAALASGADEVRRYRGASIGCLSAAITVPVGSSTSVPVRSLLKP